MTQEDKQLLLKDLCARLPYGVICKLSTKGADVSITEKLGLGGLEHFIFGTMDVLPYLRPMSSMTEEEKKEYDSRRKHVCDEYNRYCFDTVESFDWLNAHHFDYRGLIERSLALVAPDNMYR